MMCDKQPASLDINVYSPALLPAGKNAGEFSTTIHLDYAAHHPGSLLEENSSRRLNVKQKFIMNSLKRGWEVQQKGKTYIFSKNHGNNPKYFESTYLSLFLQKGFSQTHNASGKNRPA